VIAARAVGSKGPVTVQENSTCDIAKAKNMLKYGPTAGLIKETEVIVDRYRMNNSL